MAGDMSCPNCHQLDAVRNVQSVVSGQVSSGSFVGGFGGLVGGDLMGGAVGGKTGARTDLARRLAAPPQPAEPGLAASFWLAAVGIVFMTVALVQWWPAWFLAVLFWGMSVTVWVVRRRDWENDLAAWKPLRATWTTLLYCGRCDMVWHPDRRQPVRPEQRGQLLLRPDTSLGGTRS